MLYCRPKLMYSTDDQGEHHFVRVWIKIWDNRDYFDPAAVRRNEEYEDVDQAIARLDEFGDEPSFDSASRHRSLMLADWLREYKREGVLRPPVRNPEEDELLARFNGLGSLRR